MSIVKINAITVPADSGDELARRFAGRAGSVEGADGFEDFELLRPTDDRTTWLVVTRWRDEQAFLAWAQGDDFQRAHGASGGEPGSADPSARRGPVGISAELWSYSTVALHSTARAGEQPST